MDRYSRADPEPVTVRWPRPASDTLRALGAVLAGEHLAIVPGERAVYRLEGTVDTRRVALRVSMSGTHLGNWPSHTVTGEVRDVGNGSELRGELVLPGAASGTWVWVLAASAAIGVLLPVAGFAEALPLWALGFFPLLFAPEIRGRSQRRRARDIESILASIGGPRDDRNLPSPAASR